MGWHKVRRRWFANIGGLDSHGRRREVYAPGTLGPRDEAGAWEWFRTEVARRSAADATVAVSTLKSVEWVCEHYLAWAENRTT